MIEELEVVERGFRLHHLIHLIEMDSKKEIQKRDKWWVLRFSNLVETLERVSGKNYTYLREEINITEQRLKPI